MDVAPGKRKDPEIVFTHLMEGIGLALDLKGGRMFVTDFAGTVYSANLDGSNKKTLLVAQGNLTGIAYVEKPAASSRSAWFASLVETDPHECKVTSSLSVKHRPALKQAVFVPVARDGSTFHPGLKRGAGYSIARRAPRSKSPTLIKPPRLQRMPSPTGVDERERNWGIVAGVRWAR